MVFTVLRGASEASSVESHGAKMPVSKMTTAKTTTMLSVRFTDPPLNVTALPDRMRASEETLA